MLRNMTNAAIMRHVRNTYVSLPAAMKAAVDRSKQHNGAALLTMQGNTENIELGPVISLLAKHYDPSDADKMAPMLDVYEMLRAICDPDRTTDRDETYYIPVVLNPSWIYVNDLAVDDLCMARLGNPKLAPDALDILAKAVYVIEIRLCRDEPCVNSRLAHAELYVYDVKGCLGPLDRNDMAGFFLRNLPERAMGQDLGDGLVLDLSGENTVPIRLDVRRADCDPPRHCFYDVSLIYDGDVLYSGRVKSVAIRTHAIIADIVNAVTDDLSSSDRPMVLDTFRNGLYDMCYPQFHAHRKEANHHD